ncbi:hypothetical protein SAMN05421538_10958 [Paracoccus isoporae]|uniref:Uncharacterized protein n=1 Tax=Paracoccus isoporae TaxID=591205 RepID=A0A1G7ERF0_9RHOB|nr:hypothetical protein [Paracoccus isoporae]SDE66270.1 hypothetical protein SAMN05421538_10958 [Paracoccus isoporae]
MIVIIAAILGFWMGWTRAGRAGGDRKDRWQWALAHLLIFTLVALFATLILDRMV